MWSHVCVCLARVQMPYDSGYERECMGTLVHHTDCAPHRLRATLRSAGSKSHAAEWGKGFARFFYFSSCESCITWNILPRRKSSIFRSLCTWNQRALAPGLCLYPRTTEHVQTSKQPPYRQCARSWEHPQSLHNSTIMKVAPIALGLCTFCL